MTPNPQIVKQYHVFLASPSDVNAERELVRHFFERYNRHAAQLWGIRFEVIDWENYATIGVGRPQELITKQTLDRFKDSLALVIGIMAQRFGSPTGKAESGTEEEFLWALESNQKIGYPEIKWFFKRIDQFVAPPDPDVVTDSLEQWKKVRSFRKRLKDTNVFFAEFLEGNGFKETLEDDLNRWLTAPARPWATTSPKQDILGLPSISPSSAYFESIERSFHRLDIAGIDNDRAFEIPLSEIYVRLRVMFEEDVKAVPEKMQDLESIDIQTALLRFSKLVIVGDPGSGKSTFLKYVALMLARSFLANDPAIAFTKLCLQEPLPVPIFISCWDLSDYLKKRSSVQLAALIDFIVERLAANGFSTTAVSLEKMLEGGNCCLLFDGLDEVPTDTGRGTVSRLLEDFVKQFAKNRYVVTSRVRAYTGNTILKGEFTRCDIQPFDADDRAEFLKNWIGLLFKISPDQVPVDGTDASREFQSLTQAIETSDRIRPLAVNPLLLTVIAIVHWNRKRLPEQRVDLYDECVDVLLGQRKEAEHIQVGRKTGAFDEKHEQQQREERAWVRKRFSEIALHILLGDGNRDETTKVEIVKLLIPRFIDQGATTTEQAEARANFFLERQELHSGLLVSRREQSYRFVHLTFQEYLAAWYLSNQEFDQVASIIKERIRLQRWFEALQLLGSQWAKQSDEKLDRYLAWLLAHQGTSIAERAPIIALCANIVKDTVGTAELRPETRKKFRAGVEGTLDAFRPASGIPAFTQLEILEALGQLGAAVKPHLLSATKSGLFPVRRRAIEMLLPHVSDHELFEMSHVLSDRSKEVVRTYILSLFGRDSQKAFILLRKGTRYSEKATEAFVESYLQLKAALGPNELLELVKVFFEFGKTLWTETFWHPEYASRGRLLRHIDNLDVSRAVAKSDSEAIVRLCALKHLANQKVVESSDWKLIEKSAMMDEDANVRYWLLEILLEAGKNFIETKRLIHNAATKDANYHIHTRALQLLATRVKDDQDTWQLIREAVERESEASVRIAALKLLLADNKQSEEAKKIVMATFSSIKDSHQRRKEFFQFLSWVAISREERILLSKDLDAIEPGIDPLENITSYRIKLASVKLNKSETEIRELYNKVFATLSSKLGIQIKLE